MVTMEKRGKSQNQAHTRTVQVKAEELTGGSTVRVKVETTMGTGSEKAR